MAQVLDHSPASANTALAATRRPVAIDLFAGAGGLSLGFEQAGFDVVASVEYDPVHCAVHAFNFPLTEVLCRDVSDLSGDDLRAAARRGYEAHGGREPWDGDIDAIIGGPPCQGFSLIGRRLVDDKRNRLVYEFYRLVSEVRPKYVVMENVPGMLSGGHSSILNELIAEFEQNGYTVRQPVQVLNAAAHGVPQDRRRLFVLGARHGLPLPEYPEPSVHPVPRNGRGAALNGLLPVGPTVMDALGDLPDPESFDMLAASDVVELTPASLVYLESRASPLARRLRGLDDDPGDMAHPRTWDRTRLTSSLRTAHTELSISRFKATQQADTEPVSRFYRLPATGLSNTLRAGTGSERGAFTSPRPIHPTAPRVITVREAARLHTLPDWFRLHRTKWHGFRQIGNAVPALLGRAVGQTVVRALNVVPKKPTVPLQLGDPTLLGLDMAAAAEVFEADRATMPQPRRRLVPNA